MSGGSSKPKKTPVSEGEKISTQLARDQINYYRSTFAPLEGQFRDEVSKDYSSRFAGQNAAASMREITPTLAGVAAGGDMMNTGELAGGIAAGRVAGMAEGRRQRDDGMLDALGVGLGISADATSSLSDAGRLQTNAAIDRTRESLVKAQAKADTRNAALGAVAAVGGAYGTKAFLTNRQNKEAFETSMRLGGSREGYSSAYLSGWTGPSRTTIRGKP